MRRNPRIKKLLAAALAAVMLLCLLPVPALAEGDIVPYEGQTAPGTYAISTAQQLQTLAQAVNAGTSYAGSVFVLTGDIDLSPVCGPSAGNWTPIGSYTSATNNKPFSGTFDGCGHTISNLYISTTAQNQKYQALFAYLKGAVIRNVTVSGSVTANYSDTYKAGIAALAESSAFENCASDVDIKTLAASGSANYFGGIVASAINSVTITGCTNYGDISGFQRCGGIAGNASKVVLSGCTNYGSITASASYAGGVVGYGSEVAISDCSNQGQVSGKENCGGIAGSLMGTTAANSVTGCENSGPVTATGSGVGGIAGRITAAASFTAEVSGCANSGSISGQTNAGGIVGISSYAELSGCTNSGAVSASAGAVGGIAGSLMKCSLTMCSNSGGVTEAGTNGLAGGIAGEAYACSASMCANSGEVRGPAKTGGLLGSLTNYVISESSAGDSAVTLSYNTGRVTGRYSGGADDGDIGGLIGYIAASETQGQTHKVAIENCFNAGEVDAIDRDNALPRVGGLFGNLKTADIVMPDCSASIEVKNCYNAGAVSGGSQLGGIAGLLSKNPLYPGIIKVANCYSAAPSVVSGAVFGQGETPTVGTGIGQVSALADGEAVISNVFARSCGALSPVGDDGDALDPNDVVSLTGAQMVEPGFATLLGGAFARWSEDIYSPSAPGYSEETYNTYVSLYSAYDYPVLLALGGGTPLQTHNVKFAGARYATVLVDGLETYATTVAPGGSVSFTVTSKYPEHVTVQAVKVGETELQPGEGGVYTVSGISSDTIILIVTEGLPPSGGPSSGQSVEFSVTDPEGNPINGAEISVTDIGGTTPYEPSGGTWTLEAGSYSVTVQKSGYHAVSGVFAVSAGTGTIRVTLYPKDTPVRTLTLKTGSDGWRAGIYNGDILVGMSDAGENGEYAVTEFHLPTGNYTYRAFGAEGSDPWSGLCMGGGPLSISADTTLTLRFVNFSGQLTNSSNMNYTMAVTSSDGTAYFPGSESPSGGSARAWFVLPASERGAQYNYAFIPANDSFWGSSGTMYLYPNSRAEDFRPLNLSDAGKFVIAPRAAASITVPEGAELHVYHRVKFYRPLEEILPSSSSTAGGQTTYTFEVPANVKLHYELRLDGYVKKAECFTAPTTGTTIVISKNSLTPDTGFDTTDSRYAADIVMNVPDSKYIELNSGEEYELYLFRSWQAVDSITGNYYVDPDFKVEVIYGDSVAVDNQYYAGATIRAVEGKSGISIVRVTYGPLDYRDSENRSHLYSRLWSHNAAIIVVNVNPRGQARINTGIDLTEYDTVYYIRSVNGIELDKSRQYAEYTFLPSVENGELEKVSVHEPVGSRGTWDNTKWTDISPSGDGSYTARLKDGRSVIRVRAADGTEAYHVVKALGLDLTVSGASVEVSLRDGQFAFASNAGDTVRVDFSGLEMPFPKLAAIYNPGFPEKTYVAYHVAMPGGAGSNVESEHTQYDIRTTNTLTLNFDSPGSYSLTGGRIHTTSIGEGGGAHRAVTKGGMTGLQPSYTPGQNSSETVNGFFCRLPDMSFTVTGVPDTGSYHTVTITVPADAVLTVRNSLGYRKAPVNVSNGVYTFSLADGESSAAYTYYAERRGYLTQVGTFTVSASDSSISTDLTSLEWTPVVQSGTASVTVVGYESVLVENASVIISDNPANLAEKGYVLYNHGGYTVLHALLDALDSSGTAYICRRGALSPSTTISGAVGSGAGWICEVNGTAVADYAGTLVQGGDKVVFYYNPATSAQMRRAWFEQSAITAQRDGSATLTLVSTPVSNDGSGPMPVSGARVYIDGVFWGTTGADGKVTLSNLSGLALGDHAVTAAKYDAGGKNTLTYARAVLTVTGAQGGSSGGGGDSITVTFRLIGDTIHPPAYNGYINWIRTKSYTLPKGSTVGDLFVMALDDAGLAYDDVSDNYVAWICAPRVLGGYKLAEFTNGRNSGWMYTVNGVHPNVGLLYCPLSDGDEVIWHYVNDYTLETSFENSIAKYINPWLAAADVDPYPGMLGESQASAAASPIATETGESESAVTLSPKATALSGAASVSVSPSDIASAVAAAVEKGYGSIVVAPEITGTARKVVVELQKDSVSAIAAGGISLAVETPVGRVELPKSALSKIAESASGQVKISLEALDESALTAAQKSAAGGRPVYDVSITSGGAAIRNLGGEITVLLPYSLKQGEDASKVSAWFLSSSGLLIKKDGAYDSATGLVAFKTYHLSRYAVGLDYWQNPFADVKAGDWFFTDVRNATENGLMKGTGTSSFDPNGKMTRAMVVTVLYRMEGGPEVSGESGFADVKSGEWYSDAVAWASAKGIVAGYGGGLFGPGDLVTREQMASVLHRYAKYKGLAADASADIGAYSDSSKVSPWALEAVRWAVAEGLIRGASQAELSPGGGQSTRAQVAAVLMRLAENVMG